jgi:cell division protein FtsQ
VQPGADDHVSEADLSDASDLRVTLTGLGIAAGAGSPVLVHFGDSDFGNRYHLLTTNIDEWRASAGSVDSVDLRFARQVVVNPESKTVAANEKASATQTVAQAVAPRPPQRAVMTKKKH